MKYEVRILRAAEREMEELPSTIHRRISVRIMSLEAGPRPRGAKKLSGRGEFRLRIGDCRILYLIEDENLVVVVVAVGHRREVYR